MPTSGPKYRRENILEYGQKRLNPLYESDIQICSLLSQLLEYTKLEQNIETRITEIVDEKVEVAEYHYPN